VESVLFICNTTILKGKPDPYTVVFTFAFERRVIHVLTFGWRVLKVYQSCCVFAYVLCTKTKSITSNAEHLHKIRTCSREKRIIA